MIDFDALTEQDYPHSWSPSGARCTRTGCNIVGNGDDNGPCEQHPDYPKPDPADILREALERLNNSRHQVELTYVDRDDRLTDEQVHQALSGDVQAAEESVWEWASDNEHYGLKAEIEDLIPDEDERDILEADTERWQELIDAIRDRNVADPFRGLLRNTPNVLMRYDLGQGNGFDIQEQTWNWSDSQHHGWAKWLCRKVGLNRRQHRNRIGPTNLEIASSILAESSNGGALCVIWYGDVEQMVDAALAHANGEQQLITFTDPNVHLLDAINGSGFGDEMAGTIARVYDPSRVVMDTKAWGYSWTETAGPYEPAYKTDVTVKQIKGM